MIEWIRLFSLRNTIVWWIQEKSRMSDCLVKNVRLKQRHSWKVKIHITWWTLFEQAGWLCFMYLFWIQEKKSSFYHFLVRFLLFEQWRYRILYMMCILIICLALSCQFSFVETEFNLYKIMFHAQFSHLMCCWSLTCFLYHNHLFLPSFFCYF